MTGIAPAGWTVLPLQRLAHIERGRFSARPRNDPKYYGGRYPFIQTGDVRNSGGKIDSYSQTLNEEGLKVSKLFPAGTLFLTIAANIGDLGISQFPCACPDSLVAVRPNDNTHQVWLLYALSAQKQTLESIATQNAQANLNLAKLNPFPLFVPPYRSQAAIAKALEDVDRLIAALERMIAKKQAIKQGIMQQIMVHHASGPDTVSLATVTSWLSGGTPDRANASFWTGTIPWISATTLRQIEVSDSDQKVSLGAVHSGSKMAPLNSTLLLVRGSALHSEIRASLVTAPVCFNQDVKALVPSPMLVPKFLTYSIHGNASRLLRLVTSAGNTAGVLATPILQSFTIWLPSRSEQEKIVSVLDDVTQEIAKLELRLAKAQAIKQGMMQQLLTGRTRLRAKESAA